MPSCSEKLNLDAGQRELLREVQAGLARDPKQIPSKYFYDHAGSQLFDEICQLDEYYPTRTEVAIMRDHADEMGRQIDRDVMLVEYGSGSSVKTRLLLDQLIDPAAYVPVDISEQHLRESAQRIADDYPDLQVIPLCSDFTQPFELPKSARPASHVAVYFPGSTIGNLRPDEARRLLAQIADRCGSGGGLLIGIDLRKSTEILEAAYNDSRGITAQFNLNLLHRVNAELDANFDLDLWEHNAWYNDREHRIEMHLVSQAEQEVTIADRDYRFAEGESICTEYSHKYTIDGFAELAATVGFELHRSWTDAGDLFAVLHLVIPENNQERQGN
ncbi:MAG: L-histidine N(alpha)-methyltransferase [Planctomycetota bacterium]